MAIKVDNLNIQVFNLNSSIPLDYSNKGIETELSIQDDLELGEYIIKGKYIYDINDVKTPIYEFIKC